MAVLILSASAFPDVKHLKNLKIEQSREYLPPLDNSATNTIESSTGYDYPKPSIPFPNEIETITPQKSQIRPQPTLKPIDSATNNRPVKIQHPANTRPLHTVDYLPPVMTNNQRDLLVRTGAETRIVSTTVRPLQNDYLPPIRDGAETRVNVNVIPSPQPKLPTNEYLPPVSRPRPTSTTTTTTTTTTRAPPPPPPPSYAPAANTPIPSVVKPVGPYYTKFDEDNGYDYSKPSIGFDLPNNRIPTLNSGVDDNDDDDDDQKYASAPTNNVPVYTSSTTTTTEDTPPAPDVIYTPSHTLDEDGYRYKVPKTPFNF